MESTRADSLLDANDDEYYAHDTPRGITLKNAMCADGNYTREHLIRAMCALLKLVVPLHLFDQTYRCMSNGNIPTFEKLEEIAKQTNPGASALEWLQRHTNKIRTADDLALVVCGIKQVWKRSGSS